MKDISKGFQLGKCFRKKEKYLNVQVIFPLVTDHMSSNSHCVGPKLCKRKGMCTFCTFCTLCNRKKLLEGCRIWMKPLRPDYTKLNQNAFFFLRPFCNVKLATIQRRRVRVEKILHHKLTILQGSSHFIILHKLTAQFVICQYNAKNSFKWWMLYVPITTPSFSFKHLKTAK